MGQENILRDIFFDKNSHWDNFASNYGNRIRPIVLKEIDKFRWCGQKKPDLLCLLVQYVEK